MKSQAIVETPNTLQHQLKTCSHFTLRDRGEKVIMEPVSMEIDQSQQRLPADPLPFARCYQLEALEKAMKQNTIVYLETGSGKTLIAVMLLRSYAYMLRKPSPYIAVFLVPQVVLVSQQAKAVESHTDLKLGKYWGEMGVDFWSGDTWKKQIDEHEVLVMTPAILLDGLRHSFFNLNMIKVLIVDECHHARGKHPYACIMTEFYHRQLHSGESDLPRIFGMTASPIKSKGAKSGRICWEMINDLETLMNSKVYTCANESVLAEFIPFSSPKFKTYKHMEIPYALYACIVDRLHILEKKHKSSLEELDLKESTADAIKKRLSKIHSNLLFSLDELGVWLALKAAESFSCNEAESDFHAWGTLDAFGESTVKKFSIDAFNILAAYMPSGPCWSTSDDVKAKMDAGYLTSKVVCLIDILLEYRDVKDIRCIIFVERVIGAIVLQSLLSEFLSKHNSWKTKYIAGNSSMLQSQTRKKQNEIVEEFRKGVVNVIVATSILEEGLDVQTCNLVIRFDPPATICSFIQSRGRARVQNSDYILMLKSGDLSTRYRLENYLSGGDIMRKESLDHASLPCAPLKSELFDESYRVESTGAVVTLSSSVSLIYFYCSRLPSDGYFKPTPRCDIDKEKGVGILRLPKSSPVHTVRSHGHPKFLKQIVCLDACKQLHKVGALTDNLVPDIVVEEAAAQVYASDTFNSEQPKYFPSELVNCCLDKSKTLYYCYLIELKQNFDYATAVHDIVLVTRSELEFDSGSLGFDLEVDRGVLAVNLKYVGVINLSPEQVLMCRQFQVTLFRILVDYNLDRLPDALKGFNLGYNLDIDYLLLPSGNKLKEPMTIDWLSVMSFFPCDNAQNGCMTYSRNGHADAHVVHTKNGLVSSCTLLNSLVYTPHNGHIYCITGILNELDGNSLLRKRDETDISYKEYYRIRYGIKLQFERQPLFKGRHIHKVKNYLSRCRLPKEKESTNTSVELPAELCSIIMTPMSISTVYSFSFVPSIMHRIESMLIAINLTKMPMDHCIQNMKVPTLKVLEAITTKECQEKFHLESLETLGDSFLKYAASQQLFKTYQNHHEGLLSIKKDKIVSNVALCKLGCDRKLQGFIRNESFNPKQWIIPGDKSVKYTLSEDCITSTKKMYVTGRRSLKSKTVADVVEALLGAFLSTGGETAALLYMDWLGIKVDFDTLPYETFPVQSERLVNVKHMESLLNYSFRNPCLLVEALTHGSYMLPEIPRCYQRLEFLGDSVLDYLITVHLYNTYPGSSPGLLTDMRSASVNNDCYAQSAVKAKLHKHILHASHDLHKHIKATVDGFENVSLQTTFGWECEISFPKVLGDIIESLAGAIFVDSGCNKDVVFQSIRPLLEPLVTPETLKLQPVRELNELCHKNNYSLKKPVFSKNNGVSAITVVVEANGVIHKHTSTAADKKTAKKLACKQVLKSLKST